METSMLARHFATISVAALLLAVTMVSVSDAGFRRLRSSYEPGEVITARSHHGNGVISSVVRPGRNGWQVQLPGGAWTYCRRSCEETLRVETVDLTADDGHSMKGYGTLSRECGVFGCLHWEWTY
jgi:hypothetical protein